MLAPAHAGASSPVFGMVAELGADDRVVLVAIALARLLVPLVIPRFPLAIVAALVLDAADNSLLAQLSDVDLGPDGPYQSYDKALDVYYLAIAYLATMRNWTSGPAFRIGRFLFYYRLVGVFSSRCSTRARCCSCSRTRSSTSSSRTSWYRRRARSPPRSQSFPRLRRQPPDRRPGHLSRR